MVEFRDELPIASRDTEKKLEAEKALEVFRENPGKWGALASTKEDGYDDKELNNIASFHRRHFGAEFDIAKRGPVVWVRFNEDESESES